MSDRICLCLWTGRNRCTTWTLTKRTEKRLDGNFTKMLLVKYASNNAVLEAALHKAAAVRQLSTQVRRTRHAGHCWRCRDEIISDVLLWTLHVEEQRQDDQLEPTYSSSVPIRDVALKTCWKQWTIETGGEKGSRISALMARHDDNDIALCSVYLPSRK